MLDDGDGDDDDDDSGDDDGDDDCTACTDLGYSLTYIEQHFT